MSGRSKKINFLQEVQQQQQFMKFKKKTTSSQFQKLDEMVDELFKEDQQKKSYFDWSEEIGFMPKTREQKNCGSCYAISTLSMIDFRLKIQEWRARPKKQRLSSSSQKKLDDSIQQLSVQFALDCNYYNQGCDGGYSMLVGKFGQEQFLLEERHKHYVGHDQQCNHGLKGLNEIKNAVKIRDYGYLADRYGNSNHHNIMKELRNNGPMVLSFSPDDTFQYYSSGVYESLQPAQWIQQNIQRPEWTAVDHSILVYGWGEENGVKYWLCQNSWGSDFGIKGSFKIKRGDDTMGIESSAEVAEPYVVDSLTLNQIREAAKKYKSI